MEEAVTAVCAYCLKETGTLTILDGTTVELALLDVEAHDLSHGACQAHYDREMAKVRAMPDRRLSA